METSFSPSFPQALVAGLVDHDSGLQELWTATALGRATAIQPPAAVKQIPSDVQMPRVPRTLVGHGLDNPHHVGGPQICRAVPPPEDGQKGRL